MAKTKQTLPSSVNFRKLSAYTIAANCTDLSDIQQGMKEISDYLDACNKHKVKAVASAYTRFASLSAKMETLLKRKK